jgi:glycosyltransferase involved in cell wall biosynthesis
MEETVVSVVIPTYNMEKTIDKTIQSVLWQDYQDKEILIIDDASKDKTFIRICQYVFGKKFRIINNRVNLGIGANLTKCMREAKGDIIIYLCGDDYFTHNEVVSDMVRIFEADERVGVISRPYYQFIDGIHGAVNRVRSGVLESTINPSGIGFRKSAMHGEFGTRIFTEMPYMVKKVLSAGWGYQMMDYDTVAVRIHNNTCIKSSYYNESPTLSFNSIVPGHTDYGTFIMLKNRCPSLLLKEILITIRIKPLCMFSVKFWAYVLVSVLVPSCVLIRVSNWFRHNIYRRFCDIKSRSR